MDSKEVDSKTPLHHFSDDLISVLWFTAEGAPFVHQLSLTYPQNDQYGI